ncbi:hypothetical protein F4604DRAFT_818613 [Suillus subluteus]|nr:hypothetical protein F4604DRAFT_818613 [Suillus subluteus]
MNLRYSLDRGIMYEMSRRLREQCGLLASMIRNGFGMSVVQNTQNLMLLAELKMYLHEEHVREGSVKKRLKRRYCQNTTKVNPAEDDTNPFGSPQQTGSEVDEHRGLRQIAAHLIQAVEDEESFTTSEIMEVVANPSDFQQIPIKDLFDFSRAQDWLGSFYQTAIRGLDAEIELYELLDLDADGIDDAEFPQADDILDE